MDTPEGSYDSIPPEVARIDSTVDNTQWDLEIQAGEKKTGPELRFNNDHQAGLEAAQPATQVPVSIPGKVHHPSHSRLDLLDLPRGLPSFTVTHTENHLNLWPEPAQMLDHGTGDLHLTDRDRVNKHTPGPGPRCRPRSTEALPQLKPPGSINQSLQEQPGNQRRPGNQRHAKVVEDFDQQDSDSGLSSHMSQGLSSRLTLRLLQLPIPG